MSFTYFFYHKTQPDGSAKYCVVYDTSPDYRDKKDANKQVDPEDKSNYKLCLVPDVDDLYERYGNENFMTWTDFRTDVRVVQVDTTNTDISEFKRFTGRTWRWVSEEKFIQLCNEGAFRGIDEHDWFHRVTFDIFTCGLTLDSSTATRGQGATGSKYRRF